MHTPDTHDKVRLDKWLWAARFYKTRTLATEAINGGKVHVNNERVKPSRNLKIGDVLTLSKGPYKITVNVVGLSATRGPAPVAAALYQETEESIKTRAQLAEQLRAQGPSMRAFTSGRPTKKDRRQIVKFTKKSQ
ncbi:MAG: S4 domain-containing protein [Pseudomonadota bacterium]